MRVCITEHVAPGFGLVPVGSLWADDACVATDDDELFADVDTAPAPAVKRAPVRKFAAPKIEETPA